jgi:hypothetical protein
MINFINQLFNKHQIKMENKLNLLLALFGHYSYLEVKDTERLAKIAAGIDNLCDEITKDIKLPDTRPASVREKVSVEQNKSTQPVAKTQAEIDALKKAKADAAKADADKKLADDKAKAEKNAADAKIAEVLTEVVPFYACDVMPKDGKYSKSVKVHAPRGFKAWEDEAAAKAAKLDTLYPDIDTLELVLDDAWTKACRGVSNKEILEMCKKELKGFYPDLKSDQDWYSKLVNPIVGMVGFIKKAFGYKVDDKTVTVLRPSEKGLTLNAETDCYIEKSKAEEKPAAPAPKVEEKKELKTTQTSTTAKPTAKADTRVDEEAEEEDETPSLEIGDDEKEERDTAVAPAINEFDDFNEFETMVFEKLLEGARLAKDAKDEASKKAIQAENKEEVRNLIASFYENEPWTVKTDDGKWNPLLINYHNAIISEIAKNKEKWATKK